MSETIPTATHQGVLSLGNVTLRVFRLDNGQAVIHGDDMHVLMAAMADGSWTLTEADAERAAQVLRGRIIDAEWTEVPR